MNISILQVSVPTRGMGCRLEPGREREREGGGKQTNDFRAFDGSSSLTVLLCIKVNIDSLQKVVMMVVKEQGSPRWEACPLENAESTNRLKFNLFFPASF